MSVYRIDPDSGLLRPKNMQQFKETVISQSNAVKGMIGQLEAMILQNNHILEDREIIGLSPLGVDQMLTINGQLKNAIRSLSYDPQGKDKE